MNTISTNFRLSHKIQDEGFTLSAASKCNMYVSLAQKSIRLAIVDLERDKFALLEDYELITVFTPAQAAEQLRLIASENPVLQEQNWKTIRVSVSNQHFTLVPETLYDPAHQQDYLRLHSNLNPQLDDVLAYRHSSLEAVNIFAIERVLRQTIEDLFPERPIQFVHQTSSLIKSILHQAGRSIPRSMFVFVERGLVTILVADEHGLQFCNIFQYHSPEDFIYYIIFVMQEQKMNPEQETITVWGDITHDASLFTILQKYIRQVKFGRKPQNIGYSYKFDDLFEHRYFELYSLHLCE
ncbi:DUF3822 family protein [Pontibacter sp. Tf4]|uniref:DUF3822 family protein n=1 Tax=Pontibacter sp. Tf4 TaxID=2761620 RepID=UPI00162377E2|nr:DUF3822 family protein [Pontibacter sp. Tf4]MBB6610019.1 DUF3822 family protein [Pontibacter sp. Tf4]